MTRPECLEVRVIGDNDREEQSPERPEVQGTISCAGLLKYQLCDFFQHSVSPQGLYILTIFRIPNKKNNVVLR